MFGLVKKNNNYINVRISTTSHSKSIYDIKHNLRKVDTKSINKNNNRNYHFIPNENGVYKMLKEDGTGYELIKEKLQTMRKEHNDLYKDNNKRNLRERNCSFMGGVLTFSEQFRIDYEKSRKDKQEFNKFMKKFVSTTKSTLKDLSNHLDTELLYFSIHLDEKSPHVQYHLKNYDNKGNSIFYKNRTKDKLSKLQDIGFRHFGKSFGMERGVSKELKKSNTQNIPLKTYYEQQEQVLINHYNEIHKELINETKSKRRILKDLNSKTNDKKEIYKQITNLQKELRESQKIVKSKTLTVEQLEERIEVLKYELERFKSYGDQLIPLERENRDLKEENKLLLKQSDKISQERDLYKSKLDKFNDITFVEQHIKDLQENFVELEYYVEEPRKTNKTKKKKFNSYDFR